MADVQGFDGQLFGFLNINKPKGMTSHDVVGKIRKITGIRQVGHTGTLDPFAQGVLPICIGKSTRLIEFLEDDKAYIATVQFGSNTDTYDLDGQVIETFDKKITLIEIENILSKFRGEIEQLPPIYSAIKVNGKKLYEYARKGESVKIKPRRVIIEHLELQSFDFEKQIAVIEVKCSKGTYIRSLAYDIGKTLGTGAYLSELTRSQAGKFVIGNSLELEGLTLECIKENLINPTNILPLDKIAVEENDLGKIKNGVSLKKTDTVNNEYVCLTFENKVCAIGFSEDNVISLRKVFL